MAKVTTTSVLFQLGTLQNLKPGEFTFSKAIEPFSQEAFGMASDVFVGHCVRHGLNGLDFRHRSITSADQLERSEVMEALNSASKPAFDSGDIGELLERLGLSTYYGHVVPFDQLISQADPCQLPNVQRIIDSDVYQAAVRLEPLVHKVSGGDLNVLVDLSALANFENEDLLNLWHFDRAEFDSNKYGIAFIALRRAMSVIAQNARQDEKVVDAFYKFAELSTIYDHFFMAYIALADLAREGIDSAAYYLLEALASRDDLRAMLFLNSLIGNELPESLISQSLGAYKAKQMDEIQERSGQQIRSALFFHITPFEPERLNTLMGLFFSSPDDFADEMDSLVRADNIDEVIRTTVAIYENLEPEQLEAGLSKLAQAARSNLSALFALISFNRVKKEYVSELLNGFEEESFITLIQTYRVHVLLSLYRVGPASAHDAMKSIEVDADEADDDYLESLVDHGNESARRRLKELRQSLDAKIIPFNNHDDPE